MSILNGPTAGTVTRTETYQPGKTLWDWMQLLLVPFMLAIGGFWLNRIQKNREERAIEQRDKTEREIAKDNQQETALQTYIDKMSELLLSRRLHESQSEYEEACKIARVRTLTILYQSNTRRANYVLTFLRESGLVASDDAHTGIITFSNTNLRSVDLHEDNLYKIDLHKIDFSGADLTEANLSGAILSEANFREAILIKANLCNAHLKEANLGGANLGGAKLKDANLRNTNLSGVDFYQTDLTGANLSGANPTEEQLKGAKSLKGAIMPDGSIHP